MDLLLFLITILELTVSGTGCPTIEPLNSENSHEMDRDQQSGCLCRVYESYVTCYDTINCVLYPKNVQITKQTLRLTTTRIEALNEGDLNSHQMLTTFQMDMNDMFFRIAPGAFENMTNLIKVSISYNKNLQYLERDAFRGLENVQILRLDKNGFHTLKDFSYSINAITLPNLETLLIAQMPFPEVVHDDFVMNSTKLKVLKLRTCQIVRMEPEALKLFRGLEVLDLTENNLDLESLEAITEMIPVHMVHLKELHLSEMGFKNLPVKVLHNVAKTNVSTLMLNNNHFEIIERFPEMPNLEILEMQRVLALNITPGAFDLLPKLKHLNLKNNKFSEVPKAVLLNGLQHLDISYSDNYFSLENASLANLTHLCFLNLSGNNIRKINSETFKGLTNLLGLSLKDSKVFYIGSESFSSLASLKTLDLRANLFVTRGLQKNVFKGLVTLETLLLGDCKIQNLTYPVDIFEGLPNLKHLGLENNFLKSLHYQILRPLKQLTCLDISGNEFVSWDKQILQNLPLKYFNAINNRIKYITDAMIADFANIEVLFLKENPLICDCNIKSWPENLLQNNSDLKCAFPEDFTNKTILEFFRDLGNLKFCQEEEELQIYTLTLGITSLIIFFILTPVLAIYFKSNFQYWLFVMKMNLRTSIKVQDVQQQHTYDVFVSYSNEDQDFVVYLVQMLEPNLKLCVYERDFQVGSVISETILESVLNSRKTLLILSESYLKSQWCRWEAQVAENFRLFKGSFDDLVIIKLGNIPSKHLSPFLKYLMKTRVYLEWDPKKGAIFWKKLRTVLENTASSPREMV